MFQSEEMGPLIFLVRLRVNTSMARWTYKGNNAVIVAVDRQRTLALLQFKVSECHQLRGKTINAEVGLTGTRRLYDRSVDKRAEDFWALWPVTCLANSSSALA